MQRSASPVDLSKEVEEDEEDLAGLGSMGPALGPAPPARRNREMAELRQVIQQMMGTMDLLMEERQPSIDSGLFPARPGRPLEDRTLVVLQAHRAPVG